jgi:CheY-like chemotaxis protein
MAPGSAAFNYTVLVVDDDAAMLDLMTRYLSSQNLRVISTSDPETVIARATAEKPRLIVSDIAMPGMDGLTLLKALKENPDTRDIPLILLTSSRDSQDVQQGLDSGAEAYLVKPIDWKTAWPKIQAILLRS